MLADGLCLPIRDGVFDVVFSMGLVEHFGNYRVRRKLISEHVRVAKPKTGIVLIQHPNMNPSLDWLYVKYWYDYRQGYRHYTVTNQETKSHLSSLGVEILSARWIGWIPPRIVQIVYGKIRRYIPWLPDPVEGVLKRKMFEHPLTADDFLIIGRRTR